ncbi:MAG TPA: hypothetical protein DCY48_03630 [Candidatus Magasanikbacteria bacterium]|nr:MAG: hypothetical protein A3I74_04645 [Candidatus Magasanikbacteria bacterium RIFCSPLOWO2_02_FULL_47_16]OGH79494.1 MAG: hypothetical protein A3C10_01615 [Candidatus Magasanikbacteria bacterium RIFCSPHIGHO2_02_FULL_48_18]OGH83160.1 MAG: hypothetical protein A3G08_04545 [Candidatus Magasanikbacteria bacterium RIFCSPLOWO2_12_FULL_47_9b]HAZ28835.1 hypothetical protein [Candidatus Magasanikbacteria bacterium]
MKKQAVITIKIESSLKDAAMKTADELGLSLSGIVNAYLKDLVRTKQIFFDAREEKPSAYLRKALKESEEDYKNGDYYSFDDPKEALAFLKDVSDGKIKI